MAKLALKKRGAASSAANGNVKAASAKKMTKRERKLKIKKLKRKTRVRKLKRTTASATPTEAAATTTTATTEKKPATTAAIETAGAAATAAPVSALTRKKWKNKQRVLLVSSRGVSYLARHIVENLKTLMPHTRTDSKFDRKHGLVELSEIAEIRNCNKIVYLEMHRKQDAFIWLSAQPHGPSAKFGLENMHTMEELKLTGNCLKGSRPVLAFSDDFDATPHMRLLRELLTQICGTPHHHPKSQPFVDHVFNFSIIDNKIWVRNYQFGEEVNSLAEVGPRFVLNLIKIFDGCFGGMVLYENPHYVAPVLNRRLVQERASIKYNNRIAQKMSLEARKTDGNTFMVDPTDDIFRV